MTVCPFPQFGQRLDGLGNGIGIQRGKNRGVRLLAFLRSLQRNSLQGALLAGAESFHPGNAFLQSLDLIILRMQGDDPDVNPFAR